MEELEKMVIIDAGVESTVGAQRAVIIDAMATVQQFGS